MIPRRLSKHSSSDDKASPSNLGTQRSGPGLPRRHVRRVGVVATAGRARPCARRHRQVVAPLKDREDGLPPPGAFCSDARSPSSMFPPDLSGCAGSRSVAYQISPSTICGTPRPAGASHIVLGESAVAAAESPDARVGIGSRELSVSTSTQAAPLRRETTFRGCAKHFLRERAVHHLLDQSLPHRWWITTPDLRMQRPRQLLTRPSSVDQPLSEADGSHR